MAPIFPFRCDVCCLSVNSAEQLTQHFNGSRHKRKAEKAAATGGPVVTKPSDYFVSSGFVGGNMPESQLTGSESTSQGPVNEPEQATLKVNPQTYCATCRVQLTSPSQAAMHYRGGKHRQKLKLLEENAAGDEDGVSAKKARFEFCEVCNVKLLSPAVATPHYSGDKHRKKLRLLNSRGLNSNSCDAPTQPRQTSNSVVPFFPTGQANVLSANPNIGAGQTKVQSANPSISTGSSNVQSIFCSFCGISVNSQSQMEAHRTGNKHKLNVQKCIGPQTAAASLPSSHVLPSSGVLPSSSVLPSSGVLPSSSVTYSHSQQVENYNTYHQYQSISYDVPVSGQYVAQY